MAAVKEEFEKRQRQRKNKGSNAMHAQVENVEC